MTLIKKVTLILLIFVFNSNLLFAQTEREAEIYTKIKELFDKKEYNTVIKEIDNSLRISIIHDNYAPKIKYYHFVSKFKLNSDPKNIKEIESIIKDGESYLQLQAEKKSEDVSEVSKILGNLKSKLFVLQENEKLTNNIQTKIENVESKSYQEIELMVSITNYKNPKSTDQVGVVVSSTNENPELFKDKAYFRANSENNYKILINYLQPNTTYYIRSYVKSGEKIEYSPTRVIKTIEKPEEKVVQKQQENKTSKVEETTIHTVSLDAKNIKISKKSTKIEGLFTGPDLKKAGVYYSLKPFDQPNRNIKNVEAEHLKNRFVTNITSLKPDTEYYYKTYTITSKTSYLSDLKNFKTAASKGKESSLFVGFEGGQIAHYGLRLQFMSKIGLGVFANARTSFIHFDKIDPENIQKNKNEFIIGPSIRILPGINLNAGAGFGQYFTVFRNDYSTQLHKGPQNYIAGYGGIDFSIKKIGFAIGASFIDVTTTLYKPEITAGLMYKLK